MAVDLKFYIQHKNDQILLILLCSIFIIKFIEPFNISDDRAIKFGLLLALQDCFLHGLYFFIKVISIFLDFFFQIQRAIVALNNSFPATLVHSLLYLLNFYVKLLLFHCHLDFILALLNFQIFDILLIVLY